MKKVLLSTVLLSALVLAGCSNPDNSEPAASSSFSSSVSTVETSSSSSSSTSENSDSSSTSGSSSSTSSSQSADSLVGLSVTTEDAIQRYQETYPNTDITSVSLERRQDDPVYKIEGVDNSKEYELSLNAQTNEIVQQRDQDLDNDDQNEQQDTLEVDGILSVDQIADVAHSNAEGTIESFELTEDSGTTYWEVKLRDGSNETELKINAQTGNVSEQEQDN